MAAKRSLFGSLFSIRLDGLISPLLVSTNLFVHLIADVFAIYGLLPKDYPGLRDRMARMSLPRVFSDAWGNVRFTRKGAPQALLFFAVLGIIVFGGLMAVLSLLTIFSGAALAQTCIYNNPGRMFDPECNDVAQQWIDFLFNKGEMPVLVAGGAGPKWFYSEALAAALNHYSEAMLIVAALVLMYHLVSMLIETAHFGVPMGKPARQIWVPIRLVMAIGILVPINHGLNSGQYMVIKTAELGSGLATRAWNIFLNQLANENRLPLPSVPITNEVGTKLLMNYVCYFSYSERLRKLDADLSHDGKGNSSQHLVESVIELGPENDEPGRSNQFFPKKHNRATINGRTGEKYSFSSKNGLGGEDTCGAIFIPDIPAPMRDRDVDKDLAPKIYKIHREALSTLVYDMHGHGQAVMMLISKNDAFGGEAEMHPVKNLMSWNNRDPMQSIAVYHRDIKNGIEKLFLNYSLEEKENVAKDLGQYGWMMAGSFISTISRVQGMIAHSAVSGVPIVLPPKELTGNGFDVGDVKAAFIPQYGRTRDSVSEIRRKVSEDIESYAAYWRSKWAQGSGYYETVRPTAEAQCAGMIGLPSPTDPSEIKGIMATINNGMDFLIDQVFGVVDYIAQSFGVWQATESSTCGKDSASPGMKTFQLGINFTQGADLLQEMTKFGHANVNTGLRLVGMGAMLMVGGGVASAAGDIAQGIAGALPAAMSVIMGIGGSLMNAAGGASVIVGIIMQGFALVFLMIGFSFAYILPLIPFTRFFFGAVIWIGEVIESVIAIPVVALAHLNPNGEGFLPEQAKTAYYFCFSIFLRPIMMVFGLVTGLMIFMMAGYFLTFAYGFAVAASGGTAYGHEILSKIVYTLLYMYMMLVCANKSFEMITHLPNGSVDWMGGQSSKTPELGHIADMQHYEQAVSAIAINKGVSAVGEGAKGARDAIANKGKQIGAGMQQNNSIVPPGGGGGGTP